MHEGGCRSLALARDPGARPIPTFFTEKTDNEGQNNAAYQFWGDERTHYSLTRCLYETTNGGGGHMIGPEELAVETGDLPIQKSVFLGHFAKKRTP
jgi:hypothetical protein